MRFPQTNKSRRNIMRVSTKFALPLATLLFGFLFVPRPALGDVNADCPPEPASNVPIALGEVFAGPNCTLHTDGDVDSFVFTGTAGDTYQLAAAISGGAQFGPDMCLTLFDPSLKQVFFGCTHTPGLQFSVVTDQKLTATGTYTIAITEPSTANINYGVSLERLFPFPPDAQPVPKLGQLIAGDITPLTDSDAWTFTSATTGTYRVTATIPSVQFASDLCMTVYFSNFTSAGSGCTSTPRLQFAVQIDFKPTTAEAGTIMAFVYAAGNDGTKSYNLEVSCLNGSCPPIIPPPCTLSDTATYNATSSTLTMHFTVGNNLGTSAIWSAWLTYADPQGTNLDTMQTLFSQLQPITNLKAITKTLPGLPKEGNVGVLSTLSTPHLSTAKTEGIACSSWVQINTGTEP
jgi:hypothetical protein